jgi:uncharacterized protein YwqG
MLGKILDFLLPGPKAPPEQPERVRGPFPSELLLHRRKTWIPRVEERPGEAADSRFGGVGLIPEGKTWPECSNCRQPRQLFLQLSSRDLPAEVGTPFGEGYLQMFYCTNAETMCDVELESWEPFSEVSLLRVLPFDGEYQELEASPVADAFPSKVIVGWEDTDDYPNWEESEMLGVQLSDEQWEVVGEEYPRSGEKLDGWPYWVQGVEYPDCRTCGETMRMLFQIDSEKNVPHMWGDVGVGHITVCPNHPHELAFVWACH